MWLGIGLVTLVLVYLAAGRLYNPRVEELKREDEFYKSITSH